MTYKLLRHKDFTAEWEKLPVAIRDQFKKKLAKVIEQPHIPKNMLRGDLAGCYKIKLLKAGVRLVYQVKDDQVVILLITGVVCGRGRNPTLRLWPAIFSGEIDVFPSERRNMGQEIGR